VDSTDPTPDGSEGNRPKAGTFSLDRDKKNLMPYIKAALAVKSGIHFWASPWTPPLAFKKGYMTVSGADRSGSKAKKPSYYDGGNMLGDDATLTAYADYFKQFVEGYAAEGINIELVSPQNEPGYDQNYPSCLWDGTTYAKFIGKFLGPAMKDLNVKVMLGTLSNDKMDITTANAALNDATAKGFLSVAGVQWTVLDQVNSGTKFGTLPIWVSEHKCGNYPWDSSYNSSKAPNDDAYGKESWGYIRDAINKGKVSGYSAWNMVLDSSGLGIDTTRDWKQDALLVADGGKLTATPAYYVFRHVSQFVAPGAKVVSATAPSGTDAIAFKNKDGSLVAVMYNSGAANSNFMVAIGGKKLQFAMPGSGWATVVYKG
jgi:glucosylceramidase